MSRPSSGTCCRLSRDLMVAEGVVLVVWPGEVLLSVLTLGRRRPQFAVHLRTEGDAGSLLPWAAGVVFWAGVLVLVVWLR
jgi:hypothetical protein